jgi:hypothetical protein
MSMAQLIASDKARQAVSEHDAEIALVAALETTRGPWAPSELLSWVRSENHLPFDAVCSAYRGLRGQGYIVDRGDHLVGFNGVNVLKGDLLSRAT